MKMKLSKLSQHNTCVDDNILADTRQRMPQTIASAIEAIFSVLGMPMLHLRYVWQLQTNGNVWWSRTRISLYFWVFHSIQEKGQLILLTSITRKCLSCLTQSGGSKMLLLQKRLRKQWEKLGRIDQAYQPIYHLIPQLYASVGYTLRKKEYQSASTS